MAIALLLGARSPPSPQKPHPLRLPALYLSDLDHKLASSSSSHPSSLSRKSCSASFSSSFPTCSTKTFLFLSLIAVVVIATRNISACYSGWAWHYTHRCERAPPHPWINVPLPAQPPKIAIAMVIDDFLDPALRNATIENKKQYARRWGYHAHIPDIAQVRDSVPGLPVAWGKFPVIKQLLREYEYVLMIDADAVFLRDDIGLHGATQRMEKEGTSLLISNDLNGPNSGIFLMKRGQWSNDFLNQAIHSSDILSAETALLPLRFENRAFLYLLGAWPTCVAVRRFDSLLAPVSPHARRLRRGVTTVDRCLINRRPRRATGVKHFFLNTGAGFDDIADAFVGHAAGGGVAEKAKSMRQMLNAVKDSRTTAVSA